MSAEVVMNSGGRKTIETRGMKMSTQHEGVFEMKLYLRKELGKFSKIKHKNYIIKLIICNFVPRSW